MIGARRAHRLLGMVLLLPICGWALTGFVFFVKPGYKAAYGSLRLKYYPLEGSALPSRERQDPAPGATWLEMRVLRTVLGDHLLVRTEKGPEHLDPATMHVRPLPEESAIRQLLDDAVTPDRARYGTITSVVRQEEGDAPSVSATTSTGVTIDLDWSTLTVSQSGKDTRRIDLLYRIHYLQWTGFGLPDRVLGLVGLASLLVLAYLGVRLALGR